jgi:hypothetical protein
MNVYACAGQDPVNHSDTNGLDYGAPGGVPGSVDTTLPSNYYETVNITYCGGSVLQEYYGGGLATFSSYQSRTLMGIADEVVVTGRSFNPWLTVYWLDRGCPARC